MRPAADGDVRSPASAKFVAMTVITFLDPVSATVNRCANCQLATAVSVLGSVLGSKGGEPMYCPFTYKSNVLSTDSRIVADEAVLSPDIVFRKATFPTGARMSAPGVDHTYRLPDRFKAFELGLVTPTLDAQ